MGSKGSKDGFSQVPIPVTEERLLSKIEFQRLADVPPEAEWFANLTNENTNRAYRHDVTSFMRFVGIKRPDDFRSVARAHVIAWRKGLEKRKLAPATIGAYSDQTVHSFRFLSDGCSDFHRTPIPISYRTSVPIQTVQESERSDALAV